MGKRIVVQSLPDRKNDFRIWVNRIRSPKPYQDRTVIKSVYIRKSGKNPTKNWSNVQSNSQKRYLDKIKLMEEIRLGKVENKTVNLIYTPRYAYPTISGSK
jgi:hypothetical protein